MMAAVMFQGPPFLKVEGSLGPHFIILDLSLKDDGLLGVNILRLQYHDLISSKSSLNCVIMWKINTESQYLCVHER